jgi:tRNA threonylcarbamoyladenosine biosynthesis protein TsaE
MKDMNQTFLTVASEADWARVIPQIWRAANGRNVWLLNGDLGSGKTTLTKHLVQFLGGDLHVSSPTFSLVNIYEWSFEDQTMQMHHLDLYRLESVEDAINIGLEEMLDQDGLILIEWPDVARALLPDDCFEVKISHTEGKRKVLVL